MKNVFYWIGIVSVIVMLTSCGSSKNLATLPELNGRWTIVEVNGTAIMPASGQKYPTIEFNAASGNVSGYAGCNRLMGSFDVSAKPGKIDLSRVAITRMMCADMRTEENVMRAIRIVNGYKKIGADMALITGKRPVLILKRAE